MLFHHFERFLTEYESRFEKEYGYFRPIIKNVVEHYLDCGNPLTKVDPLLCPRCGGEMRIISFIEEPKIIDRIIGYLKLTFEAARPPPAHKVQQELLIAAEEKGEYF